MNVRGRAGSARGLVGHACLALVACSSRACSGDAAPNASASSAASASTPNASAPATAPGPARPRASEPEPTLAAVVQRIEGGEHGDPCEERVREWRRTVAAAVDRAWPAIEARGASLAAAPPFHRTKLGPTYVRERDGHAHAFERRGWTTLERSWEALSTTLRALPPLPIGTIAPDAAGSPGAADAGSIDEGWVSLAREARALLAFDLSRVAAGSWRDATRSSLPPPNVTPNPGVERSGNVLTILLDAGPFDAEKDRLARIIETTWTSRALGVHVRWTSQASEPRAHRLVLGRVAGEPSYVSDRLRQVHLNPDVRAAAIAHEIGHVLGLSDRYAKTYDAGRCAYRDERDARDIMSDPEGPVTREQWALLADAYPDAPVDAFRQPATARAPRP
jgi:hypothetical protein